MSPWLDFTRSARGFLRMTPIPGSYGGEVRAYESSSASRPHVWLAVEVPMDLNNPDTSGSVEAIAHLTLENAARLRDQLSFLIQHHGMVECANGVMDCFCWQTEREPT